MASVGTVMPAPKYCAYDQNGAPLSGGLLEVFFAGTSTPATTYTDVGLLVPNTHPIVLDAAGRATVYLAPGSFKFVQRTSLALGATIVWTQDKVSSVAPFNVDLDVLALAGETLQAGTAVYMAQGTEGGTTAGRWYLTDADDPTKSSEAFTVGMVPDTINAGEAGNVRLLGQITVTGPLIVGSSYFVSTIPGEIVAVEPVNVKFIGQANTTTTLIVGGIAPAQAGGGVIDNSRLNPIVPPTQVTLADVASVPLNAALGNFFTLAATDNRTIQVPTGGVNGQKIIIAHFASGADRTLTLTGGAAGFGFGTDIPALTPTINGQVDYIGAVYNATFYNRWHVVAYVKGYTG